MVCNSGIVPWWQPKREKFESFTTGKYPRNQHDWTPTNRYAQHKHAKGSKKKME